MYGRRALHPPPVYDSVLGWVRRRYGLAPATAIIRPFWPGRDYASEEYPEGCVVVDNPPFSILNDIIRGYQAKGVRFFLFAPNNTLVNNLEASHGLTIIPQGTRMVFENSRLELKVGFVTNLSPAVAVETDPALYDAVMRHYPGRRRP